MWRSILRTFLALWLAGISTIASASDETRASANSEPTIDLHRAVQRWFGPESACRQTPTGPVLRLCTGGAGRSTQFTQMEASALAGHVWHLEVRLKHREETTGLSASIYLRTTLATRETPPSLWISNQNLSSSSGETSLSMPVYIPQDAKTVIVGVSLSSAGQAAELEVGNIQLRRHVALPQAINEALKHDLEFIAENAIRAQTVNWREVNDASQAILSADPQSLNAKRDAIAFAVKALDDKHSYVPALPQAVTGSMNGGSAAPAAALTDSRQQSAGILYVRPAAITSMAESVGRAYALDLQAKILEGDSSCGLVVDLRGNSGGNMYPPLAGLWHLFGDGVLGRFVGTKTTVDWGFASGAIGSGGASILPAVAPAAQAVLRHRPVAVLLDQNTKSSAEVIALGFKVRPLTRMFGQRTAGLTTSNRRFQLQSGFPLILAVANMEDLQGNQHPNGIEPDVRLDSGLALDAAAAWLRSVCTGP